jgi:hypothetical protein
MYDFKLEHMKEIIFPHLKDIHHTVTDPSMFKIVKYFK